MFSALRALQRRLIVTVALSALVPAATLAQTVTTSGETTPTPPPPTSASPGSTGTDAHAVSEIVVTGTSLRKVVPAGAQTLTIDPAAIAATGATSTDELLSNLPQLNTFGTLPITSYGGTQVTVNRTNLRNLPQGVGGGSPTLILMDGHRIVGEGVNQDYPDPDVVPPALIQRVEVITDGGSAIYGSDAVGGVINFVTRTDFDGVQIGGRQTFGDDYESTDANLTIGKAWDGGDAYIGYNYAYHDPLFGASRSYVKNINYTTGLPASQYCSPGNAVVNGQNYAVVGGNSLVLSNANLCDPSKTAEFYPEETRNSLLGDIHQKLGSKLEFDIKGYYSSRDDDTNLGPLTGTAAVNPGNPHYIASGAGAAEQAYFNFASVGGYEHDLTKLHSSGITPMLTWKIGGDWQMKAFYNYGQSQTVVNNPQVNNAALVSDVNSGAFNPFNVGNSTSTSLAQALDYEQYGIGRENLSNAKVTFDGPLPYVRLPGGQIRVAVGGEFIGERYKGTNDTDTYENVAVAPLDSAHRNVKSGFAELNLPVIGPDNNIPLVNSFSFGAAERYDDYSDFGSNWAPNLGLTYKPVDWISARARWNKSFQAPSLVQLAQATTPQVGVYPGFIVQAVALLNNPAVPYMGGDAVNVSGTVSPLQPERAQDWDVGFDVSPPITPGLNLHVTYWNIDYSGQISAPPLGSGPFYSVSSFDDLYIMYPTTAQITAFLAHAGIPAAAIANALAELGTDRAYFVSDTRARNLGVSRDYGFDFSADYRRPMPFGSVFATFNSSYTLSAKQAVNGVDFLSNQANIGQTRFNARTVIGAKVDPDITASLMWNHLLGFDLAQPASLNQTRVGDFDTLDFYGEYMLKREGLPPIALSLNVGNIFDTHPPHYNGVFADQYDGYAGGSTLGRTFEIGASVRF